ncbi:MAG: primosomal protein N' [Pseudomonadota bacterium]|nr:primosomal protein N' [Pseudomonadota bacterium]
MKFAQVALDLPLATVFDYYLAPEFQSVPLGCRVIVPFGARKRVGIVVGLANETLLAANQLKSIFEIDARSPRLSPGDLALLRFAADYYHHPFGQTIFSALPPAYKQLALPVARGLERYYRLSPLGGDLARNAIPKRAPAQQKLLAALAHDEPVALSMLRSISPSAERWLREWMARKWIESIEVFAAPLPTGSGAVALPALNAEQHDAVQRVSASLGKFQCFLLYGITGSGKTEVYLHAVAQTLACGKQALILVPEISLTPQLESRFRARFPSVAQVSLHSALSDSERYAGWRSAAEGRAQIVLGTRLAVFTSMPQLGLIVVDEEHDPSFKQQEGLRYSARDLAVYRANAAKIPIVLGSATPSLESFAHAQRSHYSMLVLTKRAHVQAELANVKLIDTRVAKANEGLTEPLKIAIAHRLDRGEQALIFINRRGYAPVIHCRACGWMPGCPRCSTRLVFHLGIRPLRCHLCGHVEAAPGSCPQCGNVDLRPVGEGTQRIESVLRRSFPDARVLRLDRDSVSHKDAWQRHLATIAGGEADILVGTQMLAKGHDFPQLTLVGMINVDGGLYSTDFRAAERTFALVMQVAGRAGRAAHAGEVLIQTEFPDHPLFHAAVRQDYAGYAETLLNERRAAVFPPFIYQALLRIEAVSADAVIAFAKRAKHLADRLQTPVTVYQPVEANIRRIAGKTRYQIMVQSESRSSLQNFLSSWSDKLGEQTKRRVRWSIDVDPIEV